MSKAYADEVKARLGSKVRMQAIGNSKRKIRDVVVDLVNASDEDWKTIANGCFLSKSTIANLAKDKTQNPQTETVERVFRYFSMTLNINPVPINAKFGNKKKEKR